MGAGPAERGGSATGAVPRVWCGQPAGGSRPGAAGHGTHSRRVRGPARPGQQAQVRVVQVRRYRCQACGGTCTVAPWELTWRRLYSVAAMALALGLWGLVGLGLGAVRRLVNPWVHTGASEAGRWRTPLRVVAGYAPPAAASPPLHVQAFMGAARAA